MFRMGETPTYPFAFCIPATVGIVGFVSFCFLTGVLLYASYADVRWRIIPNRAVLAAACFWVFTAAAECLAGEGAQAATRFVLGAVGAAFLGGFALLSAVVLERALGKESLGGGDVKLLAAIGLYLGAEKGLAALFVACLLFLAFVLIKGERHGGMPFAPFLTCATMIVLPL